MLPTSERLPSQVADERVLPKREKDAFAEEENGRGRDLEGKDAHADALCVERRELWIGACISLVR